MTIAITKVRIYSCSADPALNGGAGEMSNIDKYAASIVGAALLTLTFRRNK